MIPICADEHELSMELCNWLIFARKCLHGIHASDATGAVDHRTPISYLFTSDAADEGR